MAATKKPASSTTKKVMDVNNPGAVGPDASSRPVIVSHKPMVEDPMMAKYDPGVPTAPKLAGKGRTIQPPKSKTATDKDNEEKPAKKTSKKTEEKSLADDLPKVIELQTSSDTATPTDRPQGTKELPKPAIETPEEPKLPTTETPDKAEPAEEKPAEPESTKPKDSDKSLGMPEGLAPKVVEEKTPESTAAEEKKRAEAEAAEKATHEKYEKMIADKTYFVPVDQSVSSSRGGKLLITILVVALLAAAVGVALIDAGIVETNIVLPFDLIQN